MPRASRERSRRAKSANGGTTVRVVTFASTREHAPIVPARHEYSIALSLAEVLAHRGSAPIPPTDNNMRTVLHAFTQLIARHARRRRAIFVALSCADGVTVAPQFAMAHARLLRHYARTATASVTHTAFTPARK